MSGRRGRRRQTARPDARARRPQRAASTTPAPRGRERRDARDAVAVYREAAGYGRVMRGSLALSLLLLVVAVVLRLAGQASPAATLSLVGVAFMVVFFSGGVVKHYRALYRVRRYSPDAWRPDLRFTAGMLMAPFGAGDPDAAPLDRALLVATLGLAGALALLLLVVSATHR